MASNELELEAWRNGKLLLGVDESGYGCLAGSMYIAGVIFPKDYDFTKLKGLNDSKKMTERRRFELETIIQADAFWYFVAEATPAEIDSTNVYYLRFEKAAEAIEANTNLPQNLDLYVDGNVPIKFTKLQLHCNTLVKGDSFSLSIAAASVLAKCAKDRQMLSLHDSFPDYGWKINKGYWSVDHVNALKSSGLTVYHRKTYCRKIFE